MNEFDEFRKAIRTSLNKGYGAIVTSYASKGKYWYYGEIALLKNLSSIRINKRNSLEAEGIYASFRGNTPQNPGWKPRVEYDSWISWRPDTIKYDAVFKVSKPEFVSELERILEEYSKDDILLQEVLRPYFLPMFTKPIGKALSDGTIELLFPTDKIKRQRAIKHLS